MRKKGLLAKAGDTIPYVICEGSDASMAGRAHHPDEVAKEGSGLKLDFEWYLSNQIHPPVARLCQPIEGTEGARLAECLGRKVVACGWVPPAPLAFGLVTNPAPPSHHRRATRGRPQRRQVPGGHALQPEPGRG
jgi:hypothetical protein